MKLKIFTIAIGILSISILANAQVVPAAYKGTPNLGVKSYPGSAWSDLGNISPEEHGNIISTSYIEQGITVYKNKNWSFEPYVAGAAGADTKGYDWNNRVLVQGGLRLNRTFKDGIVSVGSAYGSESRWQGDPTLNAGLKFTETQQEVIGYSQWWFGWKGAKGKLPGSHWGAMGNLSPVEKNNLICVGHVEQDYLLKNFAHKITLEPYTELTLSGDISNYDWENRALYGGGIKLSKSTNSSLTEFLVGYVQENRFISGMNTGQLVVHVRFWMGWDPKR